MSGAKPKTIRKIMGKKIEDWLKSIDDPDVRQVARENVIVTGGSIASLLLGEPVNDYDLYMKTRNATKILANHYVKQFDKLNPGKNIKPFVMLENLENAKGEVERRVVIKVQSSGVVGEGDDSNYQYYEAGDISGNKAEEYVEKMLHGDKNPDEDGVELPKYRPVFMSQNAISLKNNVQLIIRFYGSPEEIHNNYDFQHAMCYYDHFNDHLELPGQALECLLSKTLVYKGSLYPICSMFRTKKFIERGWKITAGEMLKMAWQINELDLGDTAVLREQLTGVDAAYFHELIKVMNREKEEGLVKEVDSTYIVSLIDRVFNG